jgi:hypothetical protein
MSALLQEGLADGTVGRNITLTLTLYIMYNKCVRKRTCFDHYRTSSGGTAKSTKEHFACTINMEGFEGISTVINRE